MKNYMILIGSILVALLFSACGGGSSSSSVKTLEVLVENPRFSIPETVSFSFNASEYIANSSTVIFVDSDSDADTAVSANAKSFTAPSIVITMVDDNVTVVTANVKTTTTYTFTLKGSDESNNSVETTVTVEIVDQQDDQAVSITDLNVSETVIVGANAFIKLKASDADGMEVVTLDLNDSEGNLIDSDSIYSDTNLSQVDVNKTFTALEVGTYTITMTAKGVIGGEGDRSTISQTYEFSVGLDTPDAFDFVNMYNQNLGVPVTTNTQTITGITTPVEFSTTRGTLIVNGVNTNSATAYVSNNDTLAVRVQTSSSYSSTISTTVSGGGVSDSFSVTTKAYVAPTPTCPSGLVYDADLGGCI